METCQCRETHQSTYPEKKFRLADFFDMHWDQYMKSPAHYVKPEQLKAVNAMRVCRTAVLGVREYACPECGEVSHVYHSCKNRFCPTCSWKDTMKWAERIKSRMLKIKHRHVVCTLPHSLHPLIKQNEQVLLGSLMRASAETFKDWFESKHRLKIGIILVLHTFGEQKDYHPHAHMIVSWGGVDIKTGKLEEIEDEYVNYKFLQKKFRCKFEDELVVLNDKGKLVHDFSHRKEFMEYVKQVNEKDWQLHLEPAISTPVEVIRYIGRYSKRACLSEHKITGMEGEFISFSYKDYKDRDENKKPKEKELSLHFSEFFPRLLQHVPAKGFRIVRYYGLYSNHGKIDEEYFYTQEEKVGPTDKDKDILICEHCQIRKIQINIYFDLRGRKERQEEMNGNIGHKRKNAA